MLQFPETFKFPTLLQIKKKTNQQNEFYGIPQLEII